MKLLDEVLKKISPSPKEEKEIEEIVKEIKDKIDREKPKEAEAMLVGSVAKGTYLKNELDIDFFILFPLNYTKEEMEKIVISIGKKILKEYKLQYAEHPYIRGTYKGYTIDLVPCYKIKSIEEKMSAVDRTPFHTEYIKRNFDEKLKNEARLLKQFLKGIGCYGAEAKIEGFSGYLAELLVLKYGSFLEVLENARNWKGKVILSLNKAEKEFEEDFVFVDPIDASRNVAAALSKEKLKLFIFASKQFLKSPKMEFFFPKEVKILDREEIEVKIKNFVGICFKKPDIIDDILYPQLRKAAKSLENLLENYDFEVLDKFWYANEEAFFGVKLKSVIIDETKLHMGPPLHEKKHVKAFIEKWKKSEIVIGEPFEKNGRMWVKIRRSYNNALELIKSKMEELNFGKNLNELKKEMKVCDNTYLSKFRKFWSEYLSNKYPWER